MQRLQTGLGCAGTWLLVALALLFGMYAMLYFAYAATWNLLDSAGNPLFAALWGGVALAVPVAAEIARRSGTRRGLRHDAVLRRVALTTIGVALPMVMLLGVLSAGT